MIRASAGPLAGLLAGAVALAAIPAGRPYREGPPVAHTGGFGEPLCTECHFGAPVNDSAGRLALDAPAVYRPGQHYRLRVRLVRPGLAAAGFQLAARFASGPRAGLQAGRLEAVDQRAAVVIDTATGVAYARQTDAGAIPAQPDRTAWTVRWTAPASSGGGAVVVHAAANAANDDASEFGDFIYATEARIPMGVGTRVDDSASVGHLFACAESGPPYSGWSDEQAGEERHHVRPRWQDRNVQRGRGGAVRVRAR